VRAEAAVPGFHVQSRELSLIEVDKRDVIAAFQINIRKRVDAVVDDDVEPVALADRRDCAAGAVAEELCNLVLGRQSTLSSSCIRRSCRWMW
jgi:hypothetical protein